MARGVGLVSITSATATDRMGQAVTPRAVAYECLVRAREGRDLREPFRGRRECACETFYDAETFAAGVTAKLVLHARDFNAGMESPLLWADGYALLCDRARRARAMPLPKTGDAA
jgi:hypothetical protein